MSEKFSDFPVVTNPNLAQIKVVGLDELGQNAQFSGDEFGGGSVTGANNIGTGEGISLATVTGQIPMKTLKVTGSGVITSDADSITINIENSTNITSGLWAFEVATGNADPGSGFFRLNQNTFATATQLYISKINNAGLDVSTLIALWVASDQLYIQSDSTASSAAIYTISAPPVLTGGTYYVVDIVWVTNGGGGFFADLGLCTFQYSQAGGAATDHSTLSGRDSANQHIAAAVSVTPSGLLTNQLQTSLTALDSGKAATVHTHLVSSITNIDQDVATLVLPPSTTITSYIQPFLSSTNDAAAQAAIGLAAGAVLSVNTQTGVVVLDAADVGAVEKFEFSTAATPLAVLAFGDSNLDGASGGNDPLLNVANANVFVYCTNGLSPYSNASLAFRNITPNGQGGSSVTAGTGTLTVTSLTNYDTFASRFTNGDVVEFITTYADGSYGLEWTRGTHNAGTLTRTTVIISTEPAFAKVPWTSAAKNVVFVNPTNTSGPTFGIKQAAMGNIGWSAADQLQKMTGRPVYLIPVSTAGTTINYWQPGGGAGKEGMNDLITYLRTAIDAIPSGPDFVDLVIMEDGTNDSGGITASDFATKWQTMYDYFADPLQNWISDGYTQWVQGEPAQSFTNYTALQWGGMREMLKVAGTTVNMVSSLGLNTTDTIHFTAASLDQKGRNAAIMSNVGSARNYEERGSNRLVVPNTMRASFPSYHLSTVGTTAHVFDTLATFTSGKLVSFQNKQVEKAYVGYDGTLSGLGFRTTGGVYTSTVADGAAAKAHVFNTPAYSTTAKIASFQNDGSEVAYIFQSGWGIFADLTTTTGFATNYFGRTASTSPFAANGGYEGFATASGTGIAHNFFTVNALGTTDKLASFKNLTTEKLYIQQDGSLVAQGGGNFSGPVVGTTGSFTTATFSGLITSTSGISGGPATHTTGTFSGLISANAGITLAASQNLTIGTGGTITTPAMVLNGPMTGGGSIALAGAIGASATITSGAGFSTGGTVASLYYTVANGGNYTSLVTDGASAIAHKFVSPAYVNATAKIFALYNNTTEQFSIDFDGAIQGKPSGFNLVFRPNPASGSRYRFFSDINVATAGMWDTYSGVYGLYFRSAKENVATGSAFGFDAITTLTTGNIMDIRNNGSTTKRVLINYQGAPGFWGATPVTTQPTAASGGGGTPVVVGVGTTMKRDDKWDGGLGGAQLDMNDVVFALKKAGLVVA